MKLVCSQCDGPLADGSLSCATCGPGARLAKLCPRCGEMIRLRAKHCLHCSTWVHSPDPPARITRPAGRARTEQEVEDAVRHLDFALAAGAPHLPDTWLDKAELFEALGCDEEARVCLLRAFDLAPRSDRVLAALGSRMGARESAGGEPQPQGDAQDADPPAASRTLDRVRAIVRGPVLPVDQREIADERWRLRHGAHWHGPSPSLGDIRGRSDAAVSLRQSELAARLDEAGVSPAPAAPASELVARADRLAATGRLDAARATVERALAGDLDVIGGGERHRRWTALLRHGELVRRALLESAGSRAIGTRREAQSVARALQDAGEPAAAAVAWALAGDGRARSRLVEATHVRDELRERLAFACASRPTLAARVREGRRSAALVAARAAAATDEIATEIAALLLALAADGPRLDLAGARARVAIALGERVTVGRRGATVLATGPGVAPEHVAIFRERGAAVLADLGTSSGTTLAGARIGAPLPVGAGLSVTLGSVSVEVAPLDPSDPLGALCVITPRERIVAALGPLALAHDRFGVASCARAWRLDLPRTPAGVSDEPTFAVLRGDGASVLLEGVPVATDVDLLLGDTLGSEGSGELLEILPPALED